MFDRNVFAPALRIGAVVVLASFVASAFGESHAATPPPPTPPPSSAAAPAAPAAPSDGFDMQRAAALFGESCSACHEVELATSQRHDRAGWQRVIDTMFGYGYVATDESAGTIVEYLTRQYPGQ